MNFAEEICRVIYGSAKDAGQEGTILWVVRHKGKGNLSSRSRFIASDGTIDNELFSTRDRFRCLKLAHTWLEDSVDHDRPLWRVLLISVDTMGSFNVIPIYDDDARIELLDFEPQSNPFDEAQRILSE